VNWKLRDIEKHLLIGSTLVEGSTLSEEDAAQVLAGRTVSGHPISEIRDLVNYRLAVQWLMQKLASVTFVSEDLILGFHRLLFEGLAGRKGQYKAYANYTYLSDGRRHEFEKPARVKSSVLEWLTDFNGDDLQSPQAGAAGLYYSFENIHPFEDGNGRIGRVLISYWLHWKHRRGWKFYLKDKLAHLDALQAANAGDLAKLTAFFAERMCAES
jgi:Fic family protein